MEHKLCRWGVCAETDPQMLMRALCCCCAWSSERKPSCEGSVPCIRLYDTSSSISRLFLPNSVGTEPEMRFRVSETVWRL